VTINGVKHALVEDLVNRDSRLVKVGDSAFGMQVTDLSDNNVRLSRDGNMVPLALGENKQTTRGGMPPGFGGLPSAPTPAPAIPFNPTSPATFPPTAPTTTTLNETAAADIVRQWRENRNGPPPWVTGNYSDDDRRMMRESFERLRAQEGR
jgi:hypothetical protein